MKLTEAEAATHTCQWFDETVEVLKDATECGAPASYKVKVMGAFTKALVYVCDEHKQEINRGFARKRHQQTTNS